MLKKNLDLDRIENYIFLILLYFLILMGIFPNTFFDYLQLNCS